MKYIHLKAEDEPPMLVDYVPFKAVVIIEQSVLPNWRADVSRWLVESGCRYMMAWGIDCSSWDDSVDYADLERHDYREIPESEFVMTTWHENESLEDVFWFAKHCALHQVHDLSDTIVLHIAASENQAEIERLYEQAKNIDIDPVVAKFLNDICEAFPEIRPRMDKHDDFMTTAKMEEFANATTEAFDEDNTKRAIEYLSFMSRRLNKDSHPKEYEFIDVYYMENLFYPQGSLAAKIGWPFVPDNLKALYIGFHGKAPI